MEYTNKQTAALINTQNRVIQLPEVMNGKTYMKNRMTASVSPEEYAAAGYVPVIQPSNPDALPLSDVKWDGDKAYREVMSEEDALLEEEALLE